MSRNLIEVRGLRKSFGKLEVHKGIDLDIREGETLALIGANGAGKTVLMETIVRIRKQSKGTITYNFPNGLNPFDEIGMQFQDSDSSTTLTPKEMIAFFKKLYGKDKVDPNQLEEMIRIFQVDTFMKTKVKKLSGGQRQRLNLLLATMHNPKLMILDEFITGLDIISVRDILDYIKLLKERNNATMIIISHQPEEIRQLSDRVALIKDGVISLEIKTKEIEEKYAGNFTDFLLGNI